MIWKTANLIFDNLNRQQYNANTDVVVKFSYENEGTTNQDKTAITYSQHSGSLWGCLLYTSPSPRDATLSRMPSSA